MPILNYTTSVAAMKSLVEVQRMLVKHGASTERVAWRIAKDWLEAQLAILQSEMVSIDQVMLPYLHVDGDKTLYQAYAERENALAPAWWRDPLGRLNPGRTTQTHQRTTEGTTT
jgi:hypothetical protein